MAKRRKAPPSYRLHRQSGQAIVTLSCAITGKRRDVLLGEHGTADSWAEYARKIAEWEQGGRVLDNAVSPPVKATSAVTVAEVMMDWWEDVLERYDVADPNGRLPARLYSQRSVVRLVRATCGAMPATSFGPLIFQDVRRQMVEKGWSRGHVNASAEIIIRAFRKAVANEIVKPEAVVALECVSRLRRGEMGAPEGEKVKPVPLADVEAAKPFLSRQARAIVDVMLLTGARCGEIVIMRPVDIEAGKVWTYRPTRHKGEHIGRERLIHIGPKAQEVIEQFMPPHRQRPLDAYLFSPAEAEAERREAQHQARKTPLSCGNKPGSAVVDDPQRKAGDRFTTDSLRRAIERACDAAFPPPKHLARQRVETEGRKGGRWETATEWRGRLEKEGVLDELVKWRQDHRWSPHQLRHTAATTIRKAAGVEVAAIILGHGSATMTDDVYAERDNLKAADIIGRVG